MPVAALVRTRSEIRERVHALRSAGARIGFVPTMGALHEGHLSLVDQARELSDAVVLSIFVNSLQFGPGEDFEAYPRTLEADAEAARERGVELLFAPTAAEMYPEGEPQVHVVAGPMADRLCGAVRPGHFRGVLTVVAKLLNIVAPDLAVFGRKDFQQAVLIRRMVRDLDMRVRIDLAPTVREADGLALSSRNTYLSEQERSRATSLYAGLVAAREAFRAGTVDAARLCRIVADRMGEAGVEPQYVEVVDPDRLDAVEVAEPGAVIAVAAYVGDTRLIDNIELTPNRA